MSAGFTVSVMIGDVPVKPAESRAVMVKLKDPLEDGGPLSVPLEELKLIPGGVELME